MKPEAPEIEFDWKHPDYAPVYKKRMEQLDWLRKDDGRLMSIKDFYKTHPVEFISDWGMTFDPRNPEVGLPAIFPFVLFPRQRQFIQFLYDHWKDRRDALCDKSRELGVSWLCVAFAVWMWTFWPGTVVGFGSRKEEYVDKIGDPKSLFWKVRKFIELLPVEFQPTHYDERKNAPHMRVLNPDTGAAIIGEAGDNIGRGNRTSVYFKDESAFYEHAEQIDSALAMTSNCKIDVSTPNGVGNPFYIKRHGGKIDVFTFHWRDDPRKDEEWYEKQKAILDPVIVAQEIDIDYEASVTDTLIPGELVNKAQNRGPAEVSSVGPRIIGVDVARFGDCETVITLRQGRLVPWQKVLRGRDTQVVAGQVRLEVEGLGGVDQIAVDDIGVGGGVTDQLRRWYRDKVVGVNASNKVDDGIHMNMRAKMWGEMLEWLKDEPCSLPKDNKLKSQLTSARYKFKAGKRMMETKEEARKRGIESPDRAESFGLTLAVPPYQPEITPVIPEWIPLDAEMGY